MFKDEDIKDLKVPLPAIIQVRQQALPLFDSVKIDELASRVQLVIHHIIQLLCRANEIH